MKKIMTMWTIVVCTATGLVAFGGEEKAVVLPSEITTLKIGMMIDSCIIDDRSFNQETWEGIKQYEAGHS